MRIQALWKHVNNQVIWKSASIEFVLAGPYNLSHLIAQNQIQTDGKNKHAPLDSLLSRTSFTCVDNYVQTYLKWISANKICLFLSAVPFCAHHSISTFIKLLFGLLLLQFHPQLPSTPSIHSTSKPSQSPLSSQNIWHALSLWFTRPWSHPSKIISVTCSHASSLFLSLDHTLSLSYDSLVILSLCRTVTLNSWNPSPPSSRLSITSSFHLSLMRTNVHRLALTNRHSSAFSEGSPPL